MLVVCWAQKVVQVRVLRSIAVAFSFSFDEFLERFGGAGVLVESAEEN